MRDGKGWLAGLMLITLLLMAAEFGGVAAPITPLQVPPFYQQLAGDNQRYAIMELPIYKGGDEDQWFAYQVTHHKYLLGGDLARNRRHPFAEDTPVLNWFWAQHIAADPDIVPPISATVGLDVLRWANIRYAALIKSPVAGQDVVGARGVIDAVWGVGARPTYSDSIMDVYQVPTAPAGGETTKYPPLLAVGPGWYSYEPDPQGGHRWVSGDKDNREASITILSLGANGSYTLTFRAFSYAQPRAVAVYYADKLLTTLTVPTDPHSFSLSLPLQAGRNLLLFRTQQPPTSPKASGGSDERLLSVGFGNLSLR